MKKANREAYRDKNLEWLKAKALEPGVKEITKGVLYRVIESGDKEGNSPKPTSVVTVRYEGRTIDGKIFDADMDGVPPAFRLRDLIPGWTIALQQMRPGDHWELYLSSDMAYGKFSQPGIPAFSTLIFDLHLLAVN